MLYSKDWIDKSPDQAKAFTRRLSQGRARLLRRHEAAGPSAPRWSTSASSTPASRTRRCTTGSSGATWTPTPRSRSTACEDQQDWYAKQRLVAKQGRVEGMIDRRFLDYALEKLGRVDVEIADGEAPWPQSAVVRLPSAARIACAPARARRPAAICASSGSRSITRPISRAGRAVAAAHHEPGFHALSRRERRGASRRRALPASRHAALARAGSRATHLRCFYHGWKFDGDGAVHRAAGGGDRASAHKVAIALLSGARISRPRLRLSRRRARRRSSRCIPSSSISTAWSRSIPTCRDCNYFQNLENALDMSHIGFVHADNVAFFEGIGLRPRARRRGIGLGRDLQLHPRRRPAARAAVRHAQHLLPHRAADRSRDRLAGIAVLVGADRRRAAHAVQPPSRAGARATSPQRIHERRQARRARDRPRRIRTLCERRARRPRRAARRRHADRVDLVRLQDDIAQVGQGLIAEPRRRAAGPRRCRRDRHPPAVGARARRCSSRAGRSRTGGATPRSCRAPGASPAIPRASAATAQAPGKAAEVIDVRPHVEIAVQLKALHAPRRRMRPRREPEPGPDAHARRARPPLTPACARSWTSAGLRRDRRRQLPGPRAARILSDRRLPRFGRRAAAEERARAAGLRAARASAASSKAQRRGFDAWVPDVRIGAGGAKVARGAEGARPRRAAASASSASARPRRARWKGCCRSASTPTS